jgi:L-fuconolactonase
MPDLKIVLNHLARPPIPDQGWEPWASIVKRAAGYPNVALKFSAGLDLVTRWQWSTPMVKRYADHVFACFGPNRVMAASNWPVVLLGASYTQVWEGITQLSAGLSPSERQAVLGGTAETIYGLA